MSARACNFTLYVGAPSLFRRSPFLRLAQLCQRYCADSFSIETFDVRDDRKAAMRAGVLKTPAVFVSVSGSPSRHLGSVAETETFLKAYSSMKV